MILDKGNDAEIVYELLRTEAWADGKAVRMSAVKHPRWEPEQSSKGKLEFQLPKIYVHVTIITWMYTKFF